MRSILKAVQAIPFGSKPNMQLYRVIGTLDMEGKGTYHDLDQVDPFIFLDDGLIEGELPVAFAKHPHTGLTAVTYLLEGSGHAWDNIHGNTPDLNRAGGVYCINSGKGVVHGEAPIQGVRKLRTLQLWFNPNIYQTPLPDASYQLFQPDELPVFEDEKLWVKVIIGQGLGLTSPVVTTWPIDYLHIKLAPKQNYTFELTDTQRRGFIYVVSGKGVFGSNNTAAQPQTCLVLGDEESQEVQVTNISDEPLEFVMATGLPHNKKFVKLLGYGGALIADTEENALTAMRVFEADQEHFGQ